MRVYYSTNVCIVIYHALQYYTLEGVTIIAIFVIINIVRKKNYLQTETGKQILLPLNWNSNVNIIPTYIYLLGIFHKSLYNNILQYCSCSIYDIILTHVGFNEHPARLLKIWKQWAANRRIKVQQFTLLRSDRRCTKSNL